MHVACVLLICLYFYPFNFLLWFLNKPAYRWTAGDLAVVGHLPQSNKPWSRTRRHLTLNITCLPERVDPGMEIWDVLSQKDYFLHSPMSTRRVAYFSLCECFLTFIVIVFFLQIALFKFASPFPLSTIQHKTHLNHKVFNIRVTFKQKFWNKNVLKVSGM